ncbi:hypothetical protein [Kingella potus]|uniref:hypothetical protein n=1 Tax=Kingella potus TaxID=265175 RepID=UPI001FD2B5DD|nr:hypothetical protein [Kingella potus]UOP01279.1 hypothetical protein LVJ84_03185 [Kingella potus]
MLPTLSARSGREQRPSERHKPRAWLCHTPYTNPAQGVPPKSDARAFHGFRKMRPSAKPFCVIFRRPLYPRSVCGTASHGSAESSCRVCRTATHAFPAA